MTGESPTTVSSRTLRRKCPDFGNPVGRVGRVGKPFPKRCVTEVCKLCRWPRPFVLLQICLCRVQSTRDRSGPHLYTPLAFPCPCMSTSHIWFKLKCELHAGFISVSWPQRLTQNSLKSLPHLVATVMCFVKDCLLTCFLLLNGVDLNGNSVIIKHQKPTTLLKIIFYFI